MPANGTTDLEEAVAARDAVRSLVAEMPSGHRLRVASLVGAIKSLLAPHDPSFAAVALGVAYTELAVELAEDEDDGQTNLNI